MKSFNKYNLSRKIPAAIRREVRQRCGFGCVVCGKGFFEYDHFEPEFSEAKEHKAEGIILLCDSCHGKKTKKLLSKETIAEAAMNPKCKQKGFSFEALDVGVTHPEIIIGNLSARNTGVLVRIYGDEVLSILSPEIEGGPYRINARMADKDGNIIFEIVENEWKSPTSNWDVEWEGAKVTIRRKLGDIILSIRSYPPDLLVIEKLDMVWRGVNIIAQEAQNVKVLTSTGIELNVGNMTIENYAVGLDITTEGVHFGTGIGNMQGSMRISFSPQPHYPSWFRYLPPSPELLQYLKNYLV